MTAASARPTRKAAVMTRLNFVLRPIPTIPHPVVSFAMCVLRSARHEAASRTSSPIVAAVGAGQQPPDLFCGQATRFGLADILLIRPDGSPRPFAERPVQFLLVEAQRAEVRLDGAPLAPRQQALEVHVLRRRDCGCRGRDRKSTRLNSSH